MILGLVGKPSSGKSTLFKALTLADVDIGPYPFVTIKPNSGVGYVKVECVCKDFGRQCNPREGYSSEGYRFVPVQLIDVAGLVPGAHEGKGMGNQFLDDLRQADALIHVVDMSGSTNEKGESVPAGSHDPGADIKFLEEELDMWYLGILKRGWERFARQVMQEKASIHKAIGKQLSGLGVSEEMAEDAIRRLGLDKDKPSSWSDGELRELATELRKRTKPIIVAANKIDVPGAQDNYDRLKNDLVVPCSAEAELALKEASRKGLVNYMPGSKDFEITGELSNQQKSGLEFIRPVVGRHTTGVQQVLNEAVFGMLGYIAIFPGGVNKLEDSEGRVLPDCFLMPPGTTALDFAYRLHTDFGKNFIKAIDVRTKMVIGKEHRLKHRDVVEIAAKK